ncbi:MAG: ABC transporter ATP-binding protein [Firmicutes bacterium]|nr:ABC transporter ATP-binding protein [Bacillota bacterium]
MLKVRNLVKIYPGAKRIAANNISFDIEGGEICAFLGMNGAGKSTTIKSITGIIPFNRGQVLLNGYDIQQDPLGAKSQFGFVPDNYKLYEKLTGNELVNYTADIYKIDSATRKERIGRLAEMFKLTKAMNQQIGSYSHGMKQKICLISTLIHNPSVWMLDEPMVGLDPQSIRAVKDYMVEHAKSGKVVFFSSHALDTVAGLCDRAIIIGAGKKLGDVKIADVNKQEGGLERHFLDLVNKADAEYQAFLRQLEHEEQELAAKHGKAKASAMMAKRAQDMALGKISND